MNNIPCRYFQSAVGCRFGDTCRFSHSKASTTASCRFYASVAGCRYGKSCYYKHDVEPPQTTQNNHDNNQVNKPIEDVPKADVNDELVVLGFIRDLLKLISKKEQKDACANISSLRNLINVCQSYYSIIIKWDAAPKWIASNMQIVDNGNCLKKSVANDWCSAFLTEEYCEGIHHWKFKIESLDSRRKFYVLFGIWKTKSGEPILNRYFTDKKYNGYAVNAIDGTLTDERTPGCGGIKYATYCKKGDIIDMFCDFNTLLLSFAINGKYYENGQKIEKTTYKVAVTMYWNGDLIRFILHDQKAFSDSAKHI